VEKLLVDSSKVESAFTSTGFSSWKKALERFLTHGNSANHKAAVQKLADLKKGENIAAE